MGMKPGTTIPVTFFLRRRIFCSWGVSWVAWRLLAQELNLPLQPRVVGLFAKVSLQNKRKETSIDLHSMTVWTHRVRWDVWRLGLYQVHWDVAWQESTSGQSLRRDTTLHRSANNCARCNKPWVSQFGDHCIVTLLLWCGVVPKFYFMKSQMGLCWHDGTQVFMLALEEWDSIPYNSSQDLEPFWWRTENEKRDLVIWAAWDNKRLCLDAAPASDCEAMSDSFPSNKQGHLKTNTVHFQVNKDIWKQLPNTVHIHVWAP